jgi:hypothetical protein
MKLTIAISAIFAASAAYSQQISDVALDECQARHDRFTDVRDCLPATEVAMRMLASVQEEDFFGEPGRTLVAECAAINEHSPGEWACVRNALRDANHLLAMVGTADRIEDPLFVGLARPDVFERLEALGAERRNEFPGVMFGGGLYQPLR